jgi:hypothetical protein
MWMKAADVLEVEISQIGDAAQPGRRRAVTATRRANARSYFTI